MLAFRVPGSQLHLPTKTSDIFQATCASKCGTSVKRMASTFSLNMKLDRREIYFNLWHLLVVLLMEKHPAPVEVGSFIPLFTKVYTFQVVQDFFHQQ